MAKQIVTYSREGFKHNTDRMDSYIAAEVLNGSNNQALEFLKNFGKLNVLPGDGYTSCYEVAKYYGLSDTYIARFLINNGFITGKLGDEIIYAGSQQAKQVVSNYATRVCVCSRAQALCGEDSEQNPFVVTINRRNTKLLSPKVVLALGAMLRFGHQKTDTVCEMFDALRISPYGSEAKKKYNFDKGIHVEEKSPTVACEQSLAPQEGVTIVPTNVVEVTPAGSIVLAPEMLSIIVKAAVKGAISEVLAIKEA